MDVDKKKLFVVKNDRMFCLAVFLHLNPRRSIKSKPLNTNCQELIFTKLFKNNKLALINTLFSTSSYISPYIISRK